MPLPPSPFRANANYADADKCIRSLATIGGAAPSLPKGDAPAPFPEMPQFSGQSHPPRFAAAQQRHLGSASVLAEARDHRPDACKREGHDGARPQNGCDKAERDQRGRQILSRPVNDAECGSRQNAYQLHASPRKMREKGAAVIDGRRPRRGTLTLRPCGVAGARRSRFGNYSTVVCSASNVTADAG